MIWIKIGLVSGDEWIMCEQLFKKADDESHRMLMIFFLIFSIHRNLMIEFIKRQNIPANMDAMAAMTKQTVTEGPAVLSATFPANT